MLILERNTNGEGEFVADNTMSGGEKMQSAVQTCSHCQAVVLIHKKDSPYGYCMKCNHVLCASCGKEAVVKGCTPFMAVIDRLMEMQYRRSQLPSSG